MYFRDHWVRITKINEYWLQPVARMVGRKQGSDEAEYKIKKLYKKVKKETN